MARLKNLGLFILSVSVLSVTHISFAGLRDTGTDSGAPVPAVSSDRASTTDAIAEGSSDQKVDANAEADELNKAKEAAKNSAEGSSKDKSKKIVRRAEAFIAGADWEFDGFIAGGQDQQVKSMFTTNDLVYLNIGTEQGLAPGERLGLYRRGDKVKDPQSGKLLGFEVKKLGIVEVTDRIDTQNCSARIISTYEAAEIGDLVRKE